MIVLLKPSRTMLFYVLIIHGLAFSSLIFLIVYSTYYWVGLIPVIVISANNILRNHYWYRSTNSCQSLVYDANEWKLQIDGEWVEAELEPDSTVTQYYLVLIFITELGEIPILIFPNSLENNQLRLLRIYLKFDYQPVEK